MKISFVIPCYRSEKMISKVIEEIKNTMEGMEQYTYEVVLINDCSPDNTFGAIKTLAEQYSFIKGITVVLWGTSMDRRYDG